MFEWRRDACYWFTAGRVYRRAHDSDFWVLMLEVG